MLEKNLEEVMRLFNPNSRRVGKIANETVMFIRILKEMSQDKQNMEVYKRVKWLLYEKDSGYDREETEDLIRFINMYERLGNKEVAKHIVAESEFMHHQLFYDR